MFDDTSTRFTMKRAFKNMTRLCTPEIESCSDKGCNQSNILVLQFIGELRNGVSSSNLPRLPMSNMGVTPSWIFLYRNFGGFCTCSWTGSRAQTRTANLDVSCAGILANETVHYLAIEPACKLIFEWSCTGSSREWVEARVHVQELI